MPRHPRVSFAILRGAASKTFSNVSLKTHFQNVIKSYKQIAMGSPLGAANFIFFLQGAANLKRLGNTGLTHRSRNRNVCEAY